MIFAEAMCDYIDITDKHEKAGMKIDAYIESVTSELNINIQKAELKVMQESGNDEDLMYLQEAAEEGAIAKIKKAVIAIIEAFKEFINNLKDKVVRVIVTKTTRDTLTKVEKKVSLNPFVKKKKVQVIDKKKPLKVIEKYKNICDKQIAKVQAGVFKQSEIDSIFKAKENFEDEYKAAIAGTAAVVTITVGELISQINEDLNKLPNIVDKVGKETTEIIERFCDSVDDEDVVASTRAAYTACANFRTKIGRAEANEHVDAVMQGISVLKKEVAKIKGNTEVDPVNESVDEIDSLFEESYDSDSLLAELESFM